MILFAHIILMDSDAGPPCASAGPTLRREGRPNPCPPRRSTSTSLIRSRSASQPAFLDRRIRRQLDRPARNQERFRVMKLVAPAWTFAHGVVATGSLALADGVGAQ